MKLKSRKRSKKAHLTRSKKAWIGWAIAAAPLFVGLIVWALFQLGLFPGGSRAEFLDLIRQASVAAREDNIAEMRRLHLDDALLTDDGVRSFFADFARLDDTQISALRPDFDRDTYCWLLLPGSSVLRKFSRSEGVWWIQGESVTVGF